MGFLAAFDWRKIILALLPSLALMALVWIVYSAGYNNGSNQMENRWHAARAVRVAEMNKLRAQMDGMENAHHEETVRITDELFKANEAYTSALAALNTKYVARLLDSEKRAGIYQRLSEAGPSEQQRLASYAAQLDRSLEEGRRVVEELRAVVEQRERELILLGQQIETDRKLMGETNGN